MASCKDDLSLLESMSSSPVVASSGQAENGRLKQHSTSKKLPLTAIVLGVFVVLVLAHELFLEEGYIHEAVMHAEGSKSRARSSIHVSSTIIPHCSSSAIVRAEPCNSTLMQSLSSKDDVIAMPDDGSFRLTPQPHPLVKAFRPDPFFRAIYDATDSENETQRCLKYGFAYDPTTITRRRIFYGALVASDTRDVIQIHATESYDMYHAVALVESNTTFLGTPRTLRFNPASLHDDDEHLYSFVTSGVFGSKTSVFVDLWLEDAPDAKQMVREAIQRESIVRRWKQQGMEPDDIGLVGDIDEFFSRDFLRAAQVCTIPEFQNASSTGECLAPKVTSLGIAYESSPECRKRAKWNHPDMILGACIDAIGDPTGRVVPVRNYRRTRGDRTKGYGAGNYLPGVVSSGRYPLWSTQDYRSNGGGFQYNWANATSRLQNYYGEWAIGFHVHNFFNDLTTLRHKYTTYGHSNTEAVHLPLSKINDDLDLVVRCMHDLPNSATGKDWKEMLRVGRVEKAFHDTEGPKPIFFRNDTYRSVRHEHVRTIVFADEKQFGSIYSYDK
jgi:hypothetical protein